MILETTKTPFLEIINLESVEIEIKVIVPGKPSKKDNEKLSTLFKEILMGTGTRWPFLNWPPTILLLSVLPVLTNFHQAFI